MPITKHAGLELSQEIITFHTSDDWTTRDLRRFSTVAETICAVLLEYESLEQVGRIPTVHPFRQGVLATTFQPRQSERRFLDVYRDLTMFLDDRNKYPFLQSSRSDGYNLNIRRIDIASPGLISFEGIDAIIREFRRFVRDLWYKNREEQKLARIRLEAAELDLEQKRIATKKMYLHYKIDELEYTKEFLTTFEPFIAVTQKRDPQFVDGGTSLLSRAAEDLSRLVADGKLLDEPDSLESEEEPLRF